MSFRKTVVGQQKKVYNTPKSLINRGFVMKIVGIILIGIVGFFVFSKFAGGAKEIVSDIGKETVKIVAKSTGEEMTKDSLGNINVLLVGYAGEEERGGLLTDTVMVASFNPTKGTVTFLSVPRDLYVTYHRGGRGRLNGAFWAKHIDSNGDFDAAAGFLMEKVTDITGIHLQYYAFVSFAGFVDFIDSLDGVTIDVPEDLDDPYYPDNNNGFEPFAIAKGLQTLDGEVALKYARSRKTTSDFSRTLRQQQIIQGMIDKISGSLSITNISKAKGLYTQALGMVKTNISLAELLGMMRYLEDEKHFFSFVYTADCDKRYFEFTFPGCVLVLGNPEDYQGQSVLLPIGASPGNINYYKHTKDFAFGVIYNQDFLLENAPVRVLNGIDKDWARRNDYNVNGLATRVAINLKAEAFWIDDIANADDLHPKSVIYVGNLKEYDHTIQVLKQFVDIDEVRVGTGDLAVGVNLVLGDDYVLKNE